MEGSSSSSSTSRVHPDSVQSATAADNAFDAANTPAKSTPVDGQGMWRSWTRVFAQPESACLDLLDNCFDAALAQGFQGRVAMESLAGFPNTVLIQNNSCRQIKRLEDALTVFKSSKNANSQKDAIGENGVGLKQGCATLSDCSIVLTRKQRTVEIGIVAKQLQSSKGVYLPSFSFNAGPNTPQQILKWLSKNPSIEDCLEEAFGPSLDDAHDMLAQLVQRMFAADWQNEDHVFLLVLCSLKKAAEAPHQLIDSVSPAKAFLQDMKSLLPEHYINLPSFNLIIEQEQVNFSFWQHRLVELNKFEVNIHPTEAFESLPESDWDQPTPNKYKLSIYCGFDAQRVDHDLHSGQGTSTCYLYFYSCQAGRLIQKVVDARHLLGLSSSGVDYTQGLTVIITDITGKLPLTPTKDGIAWSEQPSGETHRRNIFAWAGAVAQFFWTHHRNSFAVNKGSKCGNKVKETMKKAIRSFALEDQKQNHVEVTENLDDACLSQFHGIVWKRAQTTFGNHWNIRKAHHPYSTAKGPDTLFTITKVRVKRIREGNTAKRKAAEILADANEDFGAIATHATSNNGSTSVSSDEQEEQTGSGVAHPWPDVDQNDIPKLTMGMLSHLRALDIKKLFELPVLETLPMLKDKYLQVVSTPMDFWTIENERMPSYTSTKEMQQDLILIFQNCIDFNGPFTPYGRIAHEMLELLDVVFNNVTSGKRTRRKRVNYDEIVNRYNGVARGGRYVPASSGQKGVTSTAAQLERQLQAERMRVRKLQKQLAARDKRIRELEARQLGPEACESSGTMDQRAEITTLEPKNGTTGCEICGNDNEPNKIVLCDACNSEYHLCCLDPPLSSVPDGNWYCVECSPGSLWLSDDDVKMPAK